MRLGKLFVILAMVFAATGCVPGVTKDTMKVTAYFTDSAGLFVGNDVGILGVPVGEVVSITPDGDRVEVVLEVDADRKIPADAGAVVVARSVATDRYVELTPVYRGEGPTMEDGAEITTTDTPLDFDDVLEALNTFSTGIAGHAESRKAVQRIIESGSSAVEGRGQLFNDTIEGVSGALSDVHAQRKDFSATIRSLDILVATIADNDELAREFIDQVTKVARLLNEEKLNFRAALRAVDRAVVTVADFSVTHRRNVTGAVGEVTKLMKTLTSRQTELAEVLRVLPVALQNLSMLPRDGRLPVRVSPTVFLPLGEEIRQICNSLPAVLCDLINGTDPLGRQSAGQGGGR